MLGAIAGDIIGSVYEGQPIKTPHFYPLFDPRSRPTDDTVLTGVPEDIKAEAWMRLDKRMQSVVSAFTKRYH
jgi:ADP-ribosylglycohydrolase